MYLFFFVEYLPENGQQKPKHAEGWLHVCISLYQVTVLLLVYVWWLTLQHGTWIILNLQRNRLKIFSVG